MLLLALGGGASLAHAQSTLPGQDILSTPPTTNQVLGLGQNSLPQLDPLHTLTTTQTQTSGSQPARAPIENPGGIDGFIYTICMTIGGFFLSIGGWFFNAAIDLLVVKMGSILNGSLGTAIKSLWVVIRDMCNLLFIFGLIYVGLKTIWNAGDASTKRMLTGIIAAALLINFSLFFAQFVVDFANVAAYQIYKLIEIEDGAGMADAFLQYADIQTYADTQSGYLQEAVKGEATNLPSSMIIGYGFMMMIFMLIAAFVFIAGAVLLVGRFVTLVILMIFSPILLVGMAIPALGKQTDKYLRQFINSAFVAPAFMFMLYLSVVVLQAIDIKKDGSSFAAALMGGGADGFINLILYFGILIAFLLASLMVAKQMGAVGADKMVNIGQDAAKRIRGGARSAAGGVSGYLGRKAIGNRFDKWEESMEKRGVPSTSLSRRLAGNIAKTKFGSSYSAREMREAGEKAEVKKARYERTQEIREKIKLANETRTDKTQIEMERAVAGASTDQLLQILGDKDKNDPTYAAAVAAMSAGQFDNVMKAKDEDFNDVQKARLGAARSAATTEALKKAAHKANTGEKFDDATAFTKGIGKASAAQLKALGADTLITNAGYLSTSQIDDLKKSSDYTETEKARILESYESKLFDRFDAAPAEVLGNMKDQDIAKLPKKILKSEKATPYLTGRVLQKIVNDGTLAADDRKDIAQRIKELADAGSNEVNQTAVAFLETPAGELFHKVEFKQKKEPPKPSNDNSH
jgi:hypothetical protein